VRPSPETTKPGRISSASTIISAPAPTRSARSQTDHEVEHSTGEDPGGCLPTQGNCTRLRAMVSVPEQRAESLFCCPDQSGGWMMIQGRDGDQTEARRLSRRVILGQKTTLGATDLLCHSYQRKPWA
jgi:hypothetical protein